MSANANSTGTGLGPLSVFALATGGMVGGGIYVALGVVVEASAQWAWLSFLLAGIVAVTSAYSYARLSVKFGKSGGAFEFLEELNHKGLAGALSWALLAGYVLTIALYAFAFGEYVSHAFGGGIWLKRGLAIAAMGGLTLLNLAGLGKMTRVEIVIVVGNLLALIVLGVAGLFAWNPDMLVEGIEAKPLGASVIGAAAIFVSYEGFQLLTYEYDEIEQGPRRFVPLLLGSAVSVVIIYIAVALGAVMLLGAGATIEEKGVSLASAATRAFGPWGLVFMTVAAGFATSAAINSTLFSSSKLAKRVAEEGELPSLFTRTNGQEAPSAAIIVFGVLAALLAVTGSLSQIVEAASLVFLTTFLTVNVICLRHTDGPAWLPAIGILLGSVLGAALIWRLYHNAPMSLAAVVIIMLAAFLLRPVLMRNR